MVMPLLSPCLCLRGTWLLRWPWHDGGGGMGVTDQYRVSLLEIQSVLWQNSDAFPSALVCETLLLNFKDFQEAQETSRSELYILVNS